MSYTLASAVTPEREIVLNGSSLFNMATQEEKERGRFTVKYNTDSYASKLGLKWGQIPKNFTQIGLVEPGRPTAQILPAFYIKWRIDYRNGGAWQMDNPQVTLVTLEESLFRQGVDVNTYLDNPLLVRPRIAPYKVYDISDLNLMLETGREKMITQVEAFAVDFLDVQERLYGSLTLEYESAKEMYELTLVNMNASAAGGHMPPNDVNTMFVGGAAVDLFFYRSGVDTVDMINGVPDVSTWSENERRQLQGLVLQIFGCEPDFFEQAQVPGLHPYGRVGSNINVGGGPQIPFLGPSFAVGSVYCSRDNAYVLRYPLVGVGVPNDEFRKVQSYAAIYPSEAQPPYLLLHCSLMQNALIKPTIMAYPQQNFRAHDPYSPTVSTFEAGYKDMGTHTVLATIPLDWSTGMWGSVHQWANEQDYMFDVDRCRFNEITFWFTTPENIPVTFSYQKPIVCLKIVD